MDLNKLFYWIFLNIFVSFLLFKCINYIIVILSKVTKSEKEINELKVIILKQNDVILEIIDSVEEIKEYIQINLQE